MKRQQVRQEQREGDRIRKEIMGITPRTMLAIRSALLIEIRESMRVDIETRFLEVVHCFYATALHADHKFGAIRINRLIEAVNKQFGGIIDGTIDPKQDIVKWCIDNNIDFTVEVENDGRDGVAV